MKLAARLGTALCTLLLVSQTIHAQDGAAPVYSEADVEALKQQLIEARARVSTLESELESAQSTIDQLKAGQSAQTAAASDGSSSRPTRESPRST